VNINKKIISFLILSVLTVSIVFTFNSISTLSKNQADNIDLFKKEFLELSRELFNKDYNLFFDNIDFQNNNKSPKNNKQLLDFITKTYSKSGDVIVMNISDGQVTDGFSNSKMTTLFDKSIIDGYLKENILNQKTDFDLDNFDKFSADKTNTVIPSKVHFRIYNDSGIIVGYGQDFVTAKIRIEFIERQNVILFKSQFYLAIGIFVGITLLITLLMIFIMRSIIIKPLQKISAAVDVITKGDLTKNVDIKSKDEFGYLAESFNIMTGRLKESYAYLEDKVKERTSELDIKVKEITQNNIELENNKIVIQNLLEDFEEEKNNAEKLVVIRTKELSDEKARLLASINSLTMGFAIVDIKGNFMINNPSILYILDVLENIKSLDEISTILDIKGESLLKRLEKCIVDKCIIEMSELMFGKKYLRLFLTPVFSSDSVCIGGVLLIEDITEAKVLERSRDEFFAVASHELRTPLTAIRGNTEMILTDYKDKVNDSDVKEMLTDIDEASVRLIGIVNDFLEVSRLEQGNISIKNTKFDMLNVTEKVIASLNNEAEKKKLSLKIITPKKSLPEIYSDKDKIEEVLFNLVGNSIKFTESGSISISFETVDNKLKVLVSDTGKGISLKNESLLFRKFQPAGDDILVRDVTKSTGLGLYISKMMIEKMGGNIGLEKSEQGVGSVFFFTIPIVS